MATFTRFHGYAARAAADKWIQLKRKEQKAQLLRREERRHRVYILLDTFRRQQELSEAGVALARARFPD